MDSWSNTTIVLVSVWDLRSHSNAPDILWQCVRVNRQLELRSSGIWSGRPPPLPLGMVKPRALAIAGIVPFSWRTSFCWAICDLQTRCTFDNDCRCFVVGLLCLFVWLVGWLVVDVLCLALLCWQKIALKEQRDSLHCCVFLCVPRFMSSRLQRKKQESQRPVLFTKILRLPWQVTAQASQIHPSTVPATKSDARTSPWRSYFNK